MASTLFVAMLVIAAVVLVVSLLVLVTRRQTRARLATLRAGYEALLAKHGLTATTEQTLGHRIIALDGLQNTLIVYQPAADGGHLVIPLSQARDCSLRKKGVAIRNGRKSAAFEEHINGISLSLRMQDGVVVDIPVWSEALDGIEEKISMHKAAENWRQRINAAAGMRVMAAA